MLAICVPNSWSTLDWTHDTVSKNGLRFSDHSVLCLLERRVHRCPPTQRPIPCPSSPSTVRLRDRDGCSLEPPYSRSFRPAILRGKTRSTQSLELDSILCQSWQSSTVLPDPRHNRHQTPFCAWPGHLLPDHGSVLWLPTVLLSGQRSRTKVPHPFILHLDDRNLTETSDLQRCLYFISRRNNFAFSLHAAHFDAGRQPYSSPHFNFLWIYSRIELAYLCLCYTRAQLHSIPKVAHGLFSQQWSKGHWVIPVLAFNSASIGPCYPCRLDASENKRAHKQRPRLKTRAGGKLQRYWKVG